MLAQPDTTFTTADFWRFWVVHLWVEDFLELFTTVLVIYLDIVLYRQFVDEGNHARFRATLLNNLSSG